MEENENILQLDEEGNIGSIPKDFSDFLIHVKKNNKSILLYCDNLPQAERTMQALLKSGLVEQDKIQACVSGFMPPNAAVAYIKKDRYNL